MLLATMLIGPPVRGTETEESPEAFFKRHIKPVLADSCLRCHGATKQRAGLRLDSREAVLRGGHSAIVIPGEPSKSRLLDALSYEDEDLQMPPDGKLTSAQIADFKKWVELGVPWSEEPHSALDPAGGADGSASSPAPPAPARSQK